MRINKKLQITPLERVFVQGLSGHELNSRRHLEELALRSSLQDIAHRHIGCEELLTNSETSEWGLRDIMGCGSDDQKRRAALRFYSVVVTRIENGGRKGYFELEKDLELIETHAPQMNDEIAALRILLKECDCIKEI